MGTTKKQQNGVQPCHFSLYKWNIVFIKLLSISQWKHYPFFPPWNHMVIHRCRPLLTRKVKIVLIHLSPLHKYTFLITLNQLSVLSSFQQRWFSRTHKSLNRGIKRQSPIWYTILSKIFLHHLHIGNFVVPMALLWEEWFRTSKI